MTDETVTNPTSEYAPSPADIEAVALAIGEMYHELVSLYGLQSRVISEMDRDCAFEDCVMASKAIAQACARRLDMCNTKLTGQETGYAHDTFGI